MITIRMLFSLILLLHSHASLSFFSSAKHLFQYGDEREEQLNHLKDDFTKFQKESGLQIKNIQNKIERIDVNIATIKSQLRTSNKDHEFYNKKLSLLNEIHQSLFNIQFIEKEIGSLIDQHIKLLEEYKKNPKFKELVLEPRSFYSFEMVQNIHKKILHEEDILSQINAQKNDAAAELETRKKKVVTITKEFTEKKKEQEEFRAKTVVPKQEEVVKLSFAQRGELLDLEQELVSDEKQLAELRLQEINRRISLINTKLLMEYEKLKVFKENLDKAKAGLHITQEDIKEINDTVEKKKQTSLTVKDKFYEEIKNLSGQREKLKKEFNQLLKRSSMASSLHLSAWSIEPKTVETYSTQSELGSKQTQLALLDEKIDYLRAHIDLEEITLKREEINAAIVNTGYKITQRKFRSADELQQELKRFHELEAEANRQLTLFQDKRIAATNLLGVHNKELADLRHFSQVVQKEKDILFKRYPIRYESSMIFIAEAEKNITDQIDVLTKLIDVYSTIIVSASSLLKELNFILNELEAKSIWQRSEYAISWQGIKNIGTDLSYFFWDVKRLGIFYVAKFQLEPIKQSIVSSLQDPLYLIELLCALLFIVLLWILFQHGLPKIRSRFLNKKIERRMVSKTYAVIVCLLEFINKHALSLAISTSLFLALYFELINDLFPRIILNLLFIPFSMYIATLFIRYVIFFNRSYMFILFAKTFERRFFIVSTLFAYFTIIVIFFREAFMLATLHKSELPTILLAGYSIFLRTLIIFSIGKDEIISLLINKGPLWNWFASIIDRYYYLLLISIVAIMVISDPYVGGYGNLVSYLLWGIIGSIIVVKLIHLSYFYAKRWSANIFFYSDEEAMRERFVYAKTSYGLFIISLMVVFILIGILVGMKIWAFPITFKEITQIIQVPLFETSIDKTTGQIIWFTPGKLLMIMAFIAGGFLLALAINRFVFRLIFNILPVDLGVQNTIVSITRYLIVVIAIFLGFQWGGLGSLLLAIGIVIGSIGYIVKDDRHQERLVDFGAPAGECSRQPSPLT